jgi:AcrR family transcriptional regulator
MARRAAEARTALPETYKEQVRKRIEDVRKEVIRDAATKVFLRKGFRRTTMNDVAKEAKVSKATLYLYYKNKEELLEAMSKISQPFVQARFKELIEKRKLPSYNTVLPNIPNVDSLRIFVEALAEASRNADMLKIVKENIDNRRSIAEEFVREKKPTATSLQSPTLKFVMSYFGIQVFLALQYITDTQANQIFGELVDQMLKDAESG